MVGIVKLHGTIKHESEEYTYVNLSSYQYSNHVLYTCTQCSRFLLLHQTDPPYWTAGLRCPFCERDLLTSRLEYDTSEGVVKET